MRKSYTPLIFIYVQFVYLANIMCIIPYHVNYLKGLIHLCEHKTTVTKAKG